MAADDVSVAVLGVLGIATALIFVAYRRYTSSRYARLSGAVDGGAGESMDPRGAKTEGAASRNTSPAVAVDCAVWPIDRLADMHGLSRREAEVVREYAAGRSARYIADALMLSEHTVKTHLRRAYAKIGIHSRRDLLDRAEEVEAQMHLRSRRLRGRSAHRSGGPSRSYAMLCAMADPVSLPMVRPLELEQCLTKLRLYMNRWVSSPMAKMPSAALPFCRMARQSESVLTPPMVVT